MSPEISVWLASLGGALLFFLAGCFAARHRGLSAGAHQAEADALRATLLSAHTNAETAREALTEVRADLATTRRDLARAQHEVTVAKRKEERPDLALEVEALRARLAEASALRDENTKLRATASERGVVDKRVAELTAEVARLRASGLRQLPPQMPPPLRRRPEASSPPPTGACTSDALQGLLERMSIAGMRGAALADDLGLPIAGLGEHASSLAAFGGYLSGIATKARDYLPLGAVRRIIIEDDQQATVVACPRYLNDGHIALVTLSVGAAPPHGQMTRLLEDAAVVLS